MSSVDAADDAVADPRDEELHTLKEENARLAALMRFHVEEAASVAEQTALLIDAKEAALRANADEMSVREADLATLSEVCRGLRAAISSKDAAIEELERELAVHRQHREKSEFVLSAVDQVVVPAATVKDPVAFLTKQSCAGDCLQYLDIFQALALGCRRPQLRALLATSRQPFPPPAAWLCYQMGREWCPPAGVGKEDVFRGQEFWQYATRPVPFDPAGRHWPDGQGGYLVRDEGHQGYTTADFLRCPEAIAARLTEAEIIGLRLCTGPGGAALNRALRVNSGRFPITQWVVDCAIGKLAAACPPEVFSTNLLSPPNPKWEAQYHAFGRDTVLDLIVVDPAYRVASVGCATASGTPDQPVFVCQPLALAGTERAAAADVGWVAQVPGRAARLVPSRTLLIPARLPLPEPLSAEGEAQRAFHFRAWFPWDEAHHCPLVLGLSEVTPAVNQALVALLQPPLTAGEVEQRLSSLEDFCAVTTADHLAGVTSWWAAAEAAPLEALGRPVLPRRGLPIDQLPAFLQPTAAEELEEEEAQDRDQITAEEEAASLRGLAVCWLVHPQGALRQALGALNDERQQVIRQRQQQWDRNETLRNLVRASDTLELLGERNSLKVLAAREDCVQRRERLLQDHRDHACSLGLVPGPGDREPAVRRASSGGASAVPPPPKGDGWASPPLMPAAGDPPSPGIHSPPSSEQPRGFPSASPKATPLQRKMLAPLSYGQGPAAQSKSTLAVPSFPKVPQTTAKSSRLRSPYSL